MSIPLKDLLERHCGGVRGGWSNLQVRICGALCAVPVCRCGSLGGEKRARRRRLEQPSGTTWMCACGRKTSVPVCVFLVLKRHVHVLYLPSIYTLHIHANNNNTTGRHSWRLLGAPRFHPHHPLAMHPHPNFSPCPPVTNHISTQRQHNRPMLSPHHYVTHIHPYHNDRPSSPAAPRCPC